MTITDLDAAQAELFQLHDAIARRDEHIVRLTLELAAHAWLLNGEPMPTPPSSTGGHTTSV